MAAPAARVDQPGDLVEREPEPLGRFTNRSNVTASSVYSRSIRMELGYHVTLVRDATAAFSPAMMHAAHELNGPTFAHAIVTTDDLLAALPQMS